MLFYIFLAAYGIFNLYTFFLMGWDKNLALKNKYRISEARFFQLSLYGGSLGVLIAMPVWRHKNKKWSFRRNIYVIAATQLLLLIVITRMVF
jgi:uncharacterized membrane protein YsdA (DUF1294 family)